MIVGTSCGTWRTVTLKAADVLPARSPSPPPNPSETLTLKVCVSPPSYMLGVHTNVPFGSIVDPHGMSPSSLYSSRCAGRSASAAGTSKRSSDSSDAFMSGIGPTEGGSLSSATAIRKVRTLEFPCCVAFTTGAWMPSCPSDGVHENVPFAGSIEAPSGAPASE